MGEMQDKFDSRVREALASERQRENELREAELAAQENPALAAEWCLETTVQMRRFYRRYLRSRFGIAVRRLDKPGRIVARSRVPRDRREKSLCLNAIAAHSTFETAWAGIYVATKRAAANSEDPAPAVCEAFFEVARATPVLYGEVAERGADSTAKESAAVNLSGWLGTQLSLQYERVRGALDEVARAEGRSRYKQFVRELPSTSLTAWSEWRRGEPLRPGTGNRSFVSRASELLAALGSEEDRLLKHGGKLAEAEADAALEDFELREAMRQQLGQLESWVKNASLSQREVQVHELDMRTDHDTAAIAHELGIPPKKVRDYRSRYIAKIKRAAGL